MKILEDFEKKDRNIVIIAGVVLLVIAVTGILLWQVNKADDLSSDETDASSNMACGQYGCSQDSDCAGWNNGAGDFECDEVMSHIPSQQRCIRYRCPTGYRLVKPCTCEAEVEEENVCEGGGWVRKPTTFSEDESFTISGYGEDDDGISFTSIDVKLDGVSISSYKVSKQVNGNRTDWTTTLSNLDPGSHTIEASWKDGEGNSSDDCSVSQTFTVTASANDEEEEDGDENEDTNVPTQQDNTTTTTTSTPQTGLLDEAWGKVVLGFGILAVGMIFRKFNFFELGWSGVSIARDSSSRESKREKFSTEFERKVVKGN